MMDSAWVSKVLLSSNVCQELESEDTSKCFALRLHHPWSSQGWVRNGQGRELWVWLRERYGLVRQRVPGSVTVSVHKDVTGKLLEIQSLNFQPRCCQPDVNARSSNWIWTARPPCMPNLKLTGRTWEFFWSACQEVSRLLTTYNLWQHHLAWSERSTVVPLNRLLIPTSFFLLLSLTFIPPHSPRLLRLHLFDTSTASMTCVELLLSVSCYCCLRSPTAGWANKACMWSWGPLDIFLTPTTLPS